MVPKAWADKTSLLAMSAYFKISNILYYASWSYSMYVPKRSIVVVFLFYIKKTEFQPQGGYIYT